MSKHDDEERVRKMTDEELVQTLAARETLLDFVAPHYANIYKERVQTAKQELLRRRNVN